MKNIFSGELKYINPKLLVSEDKDDKIENFFITLGLVFNDLKGLILFEKLVIDNFEKPQEDKATSHLGNYGGVMAQIHRLFASAIHEFFEFLNENEEILSKNEFKEIMNKLPVEDKSLWEGLFAAAAGNLYKLTDFLKTLLRIRNNLGFHYYDSGKNLRRGYVSFFNRKKNCKNEFAYYSIGETVEVTRFFFSDAAADEAVQLVAGKEEKGEANDPLEQYRNQLTYTINVLNLAIISIFRKYLQSRRNGQC
jgi:hypothetical protein